MFPFTQVDVFGGRRGDPRRREALKAASASLLLFAALPAWSQQIADTAIRSSQLRGNLHLLQGYGGNTVVSTGADGTLIVDDEYAVLSGKLRAAIAKLSDRSVRYVINTHWHNDHTGGNEDLGRSGALILAQDNSRRRMMSDQVMSLYGPQPAYGPAGQPRLGFGTSMRLVHNGDTIDIIHVGPAHTDGDAVVHFRREDVLLTGDLFVGYDYRPPFFDDLNGGSLEGMIAAAQTIVDLAGDKTVVIPGHGDAAARTDVIAYRAGLVAIRDRIRQAIARGDSEDEVVAAKPVGDFAITGRGTDRWVRIVYREYR